MATWDDVRKLALGLPKAEEGTTHGMPAFKIGGKLFAWESSHEPGALAVYCDPGERPLMIEALPEMYFVTPHYETSSIVLVHLKHADDRELAERIEESWLIRAPKKLANAYVSD